MKVPVVVNLEKSYPGILKWISSGLINLQALANKYQVIPVSGGDGTLLRAISDHQRRNLPFLGIKGGTEGFLLNPFDDPEELKAAFTTGKTIALSQLDVSFVFRNGSVVDTQAFNDVFLNALYGTVCYGTIYGDDYPTKQFVGDGIIIATPQGSTAYNKNAGGGVIPLSSNDLAIRTNNAKKGIRDSVAAQKLTIDIIKGKVIAHADSKRYDDVARIIVRPSRKQVRLIFKEGYHFEMKRYED